MKLTITVAQHVGSKLFLQKAKELGSFIIKMGPVCQNKRDNPYPEGNGEPLTNQ